MATARSASPRRSRSGDRAEQIVAAARKLFGQRGYRAVSVQDIGDEVGLDASSLYFHFPNKEAILVAVFESLLDTFEEHIGEVMATPGSVEEHLAVLAEDAVRYQVLDRHYFLATPADLRLIPPDLVRELNRKRKAAARPGVESLLALHRGLAQAEAELIIDALGCLPLSLRNHRPEIPKQAVVDVLGRMALAALFVPALSDRAVAAGVSLPRHETPPSKPQPNGRRPRPYERTPASSREQILAAALSLFRAGGFDGVGVDDLAGALGITGPGVYRHFESKEEILQTLVTRAMGELAMTVRRALSKAATAREALDRLIAQTVQLALEDPDLLAVFWMQRDALGKESRLLIAREFRGYIKDWTGVLVDVRPELREEEARTMVHSALWLVNSYWWSNTSRLPTEQAGPLLRSITTSALLCS